MNWNRKKVLVTGGALFIGSAVVDALVERGLHRTIDWYFSTKDRAIVAAVLDRLLTERQPAATTVESQAAVAD